MNVQTIVSNARSFSELLPIAERATPHFSFWRSGYVSVSGYEGTLDICALASRTMELLDQFNYEFSLAEHAAGKRLAARIDRIFNEHDCQVRRASCLTLVLDILRHLPCALFNYFMYGDRGVMYRWRGQEPHNNVFEYYTRAQFQSAFGMSPEEAERRGFIQDYETDWAGPDRWSLRSGCLSPFMRRSTT